RTANTGGLWNPLTFSYGAACSPQPPQSGLPCRVSDGTNYLEFVYDTSGRLTEVHDQRRASDSNSPAVHYAYDTNGNLSQVTDLRGQVWNYSYQTGTHLLTQVTDPLGHTVESQTYDSQERVTEQRDGNNNVIVQINYQDPQNVVITDSL